MNRLAAITFVIALVSMAQQNRRGRNGEEETFHTTVPAHRYDLTLGRPEARSVTATVLAYEDLTGYFEMGSIRTAEKPFPNGAPVAVAIDGLTPNTAYSYRFHFRARGASAFESSPEHRFHTQRAPGVPFTFAVQSDSHLDENSDPETYKRTLANIAADRPDFLIDLGDTFMVDKRRSDFRKAAPQYLAQRYYFGLIAHSVPLLLALGNHDGEDGSRAEMATWSLGMRTRYFPNPRANGFHTGNTSRENYYAWQWGDAHFIVLDPFWPTTSRARGDLWRWTLGEAQYRWLRETLATSRAAFKFVFIHHPIGANDEPIRGGVEAAKYGEWGGLDSDGKNAFAKHRPGWEMPIHALLAKHGVDAVFHGHDHLYSREELDGVVYQEVQQPGHPRVGAAPRNAFDYGYDPAKVIGGSGHLRVRVTSESARVEFVAGIAAGRETAAHRNGGVVHGYTITRRKAIR